MQMIKERRLKKASEYSQPIRALEELEERIENKLERKVEWKVGEEESSVPVWTLDNRRGNYAVVKAHVRGGTKFPRHVHSQKEFIICTEGRAIFRAGTTTDVMSATQTMLRGDCVTIEPGRIHEIEAIEDTWFIVVTIPESEAFAK